MAELVVVAFPGDMQGADRATDRLEQLGDQGVITPDDAVNVVVDDKGKLHLRQAFELTGERVLEGAVIGGALGFVATIPFGPIGAAAYLALVLGGSAIGAVTGGVIGRHADYGIPDDVVEQLGDALTPGSSALFVLVPDDQADTARERFDDLGATVVCNCLDAEQEQCVRDAMTHAAGRAGGAEA